MSAPACQLSPGDLAEGWRRGKSKPVWMRLSVQKKVHILEDAKVLNEAFDIDKRILIEATNAATFIGNDELDVSTRHLNGIVASISLGTARLYTVSQGCSPFGTNDVEPQVEFPTNLTRSLHADPTNEIISYLLIDPSRDFQFLVPIQLQNLVFDLRGIHTFFTFQIQVMNIDWRNRSHPYFSQRLAVAICV